MTDNSGFNLDSLVVRLVFAFLVIGVTIHMIPELLQAVWSVMPSVLILVLIIGALRGMARKFLG
jgi:hypothetical protein